MCKSNAKAGDDDAQSLNTNFSVWGWFYLFYIKFSTLVLALHSIDKDSMIKCPRWQNAHVWQNAQSQYAQMTFCPIMTKCPS